MIPCILPRHFQKNPGPVDQSREEVVKVDLYLALPLRPKMMFGDTGYIESTWRPTVEIESTPLPPSHSVGSQSTALNELKCKASRRLELPCRKHYRSAAGSELLKLLLPPQRRKILVPRVCQQAAFANFLPLRAKFQLSIPKMSLPFSLSLSLAGRFAISLGCLISVSSDMYLPATLPPEEQRISFSKLVPPVVGLRTGYELS